MSNTSLEQKMWDKLSGKSDLIHSFNVSGVTVEPFFNDDVYRKWNFEVHLDYYIDQEVPISKNIKYAEFIFEDSIEKIDIKTCEINISQNVQEINIGGHRFPGKTDINCNIVIYGKRL